MDSIVLSLSAAEHMELSVGTVRACKSDPKIDPCVSFFDSENSYPSMRLNPETSTWMNEFLRAHEGGH